MHSCNDSLQSDALHGVASRPLTRAGLRQPPRRVEPTGVFVVVEMTVLVFVTALAMVSIILSIDDVDAHGSGPDASRTASRSVAAADRPAGTPSERQSLQDITARRNRAEHAAR